jgi:hypothetical protein
VAAVVGDQERIEQFLHKDPGLTRRLDSARESPLSYASPGRLFADRPPLARARRRSE